MADSMPHLTYDGAVTLSSEVNNPGIGQLQRSCYDFYPNPATTPALPRHSMEYLFRVMKTWPRMIARGFQLPPIFHHSQTTSCDAPQPLAKCFMLTKMWYNENQASPEMIRTAVLAEMEIIFNTYCIMDQETLSASVQALVIYLLLLMFPTTKTTSEVSFLDPYIFVKITNIAYYLAINGLILTEERKHTMPKWEDWINVNMKRRAALSIYLLNWCYSVYHCLPAIACDELAFLPAPTAKVLWQARSEEEWRFLYARWLKNWDRCGYLQGEFLLIEQGIQMDERSEMWLEETDELGIMFMGILNAVEREPEFSEKVNIR
ncbi:C6 finger-containing protein [Glarea lozoyensis ATCC 20868]|uniref:C6 finger-containing protein n=1 Tax=Glarea lozoyensis (strain ATCC 20868 / MF5171) TaxID=1116229 RepID=S3CWY9_GLAL2|nr:C6 finger-containing protein [Glarea lozoyensis ATCC 20868]EPE30857.1 C6 finger-containing protein [Glarea lozoyensis ATCC 20868]